jgi:hypothetical protein
MSKTLCVYVVLSKSPTMLSRAVNRLKGDSYTHAALSLDKELSYMFSFGRRRARNPFTGCFKRESLGEGLYKKITSLPGVVLEVPVTPKQYCAVCDLIESFLLNAHIYGYNYLGLAGNLLGVACGGDRRFFCSEFVYYVLRESGVCDLDAPRGLVRPQTLLRLKGRIIFAGDLKMYGGRYDAMTDALPIFRFPRFSETV